MKNFPFRIGDQDVEEAVKYYSPANFAQEASPIRSLRKHSSRSKKSLRPRECINHLAGESSLTLRKMSNNSK